MDMQKIGKLDLLAFGEVNLKRYGLHTIKNRAFPNLIDGLKPVHRRILWAMFKKGLVPDHKALKAAVTVGETLGNYHPHGDAAVTDTMANMVHSPEPLIDGNGSNWGSLTTNPAAPRYTEARLSKFSFTNFFDPAYIATTDMEPNYDGRLFEPVALPSNTFHMIVNGVEGIGVGTTCNIPSFTLKSVNALLIKALQSKERLKAADVMRILKFSNVYGGHMSDVPENKVGFKSFLENGTGSILFHPDYTVENKGTRLVVTGFPKKMRTGTVLERLAEHPLVGSMTNETSIESGIKFVFTAKKGAKFEGRSFDTLLRHMSDKQAFRIAYLIETVHEVDGKYITNSTLKESGLIDALYDWIIERRTAFTKATKWRIDQEQRKLDKTNLQLLAHTNRDVLDACRDQKDPKAYLIAKLKVDSEGADYLLGMTVMQLTRINGDKIKAKIKEHNSIIAGFKGQLKNVEATIVEELKSFN